MSTKAPSNGARPAQIATGVAPPHSLQAEQSVLGGILLSDRAMYGLVIEEGLKERPSTANATASSSTRCVACTATASPSTY